MAAHVDQPRLSAATIKAGFKVLPRISIDMGAGTTDVQGMVPREVNEITGFYTLLGYADRLDIMPPIFDSSSKSEGSPSVWMFKRRPDNGIDVVYPGSGADARLLAAIPTKEQYKRKLRECHQRLKSSGYALLHDRFVLRRERPWRGGGGFDLWVLVA